MSTTIPIIAVVVVTIIYCNLLEYLFRRFILCYSFSKKNVLAFFNFNFEHYLKIRRELLYDEFFELGLYYYVLRKEAICLLTIMLVHFILYLLFLPLMSLAFIIFYFSLYYFVHKRIHRCITFGIKYFRWHVEHHVGEKNKNFNLLFPLFDYIFRSRARMEESKFQIALRSRKWF
jgi:sterol desaturase/sphingolipid hydroxylase (fatty acid hydroxylase superfamily)